MKFGCKPSTIDGTEHIYNLTNPLKLPTSYSYIAQLPKVLNQGNESICVPCSISSIICFKLKTLNYPVEITLDNARLLFKKCNGSSEGMSIKDALSYVRHTGYPTNHGLIKEHEYAKIGNQDSLKQAIFMNGPCVGALPVKDSSISQFWKGTSIEGYHAIAIVGWDDKGFIIRNSWGESFGHKGYVILPYKEFSNFIELWTII